LSRVNGQPVTLEEVRVKVPGFVERNRKVDLNAAGAKRLTALSGIGPVLAERIVAYRKEHGDFSRPAELEEVSGIGPSTLEEIRDRLRAEG
jgi:competence ComEA-like helix-hairpin-helix protein